MKKNLLSFIMLCLSLHLFSQNNAPQNKQQTATAVNAYCSSKGSSTAFEYIQLVNFGGTDMVSGNNNGYGDFSWVTAYVTAGQTISAQIKAGYTGAVRPEAWTMYIDYNQDGDFNDAGEKVGSVKTNTASLVNTKLFTIPASAKTGETKMRIQMHYNTVVTNPCATLDYGEVEDYSVYIANANGKTNQEMISKITVFPNPVNSSIARLSYTLTSGGNISFKLSDSKGFMLSSYKAGIQNKGVNSYSLTNLAALHNGYYYVLIEQDGRVIGKTALLVEH